MTDKAPAETGIFETNLARCRANYAALTPLSFLQRSARLFADKAAVVHGDLSWSYAEFNARCCRLASALAGRGIAAGDTVAVIAPNVPALLECHYAVPMLGAVLNAINTRLDAASIAFILEHGEAKALIADRELSATVSRALKTVSRDLLVIDYQDTTLDQEFGCAGALDYDSLLAEGDPGFAWRPPADEWRAIALNYTSGTTGNPKGVVYSHRGAYLNALANALTFGLRPDSVYLWTLPMFHCNGWTYTWAVTAVGGTHVCLRQIDPPVVFDLIAKHGVTHLCGAPIVLNLLANAPAARDLRFRHRVEVATGGAAPPSAIIEAMERIGLGVTHLYGLTESYGPATVCIWQDAWDGLDLPARAGRMARQGVHHALMDDMMVSQPETLVEVPDDGATVGEIMLRGNTVMKGYLKNPSATAKDFAGGWFHTGDLAVRHPDGYVEVKDRSKDVIISGGENISSLEVEEVLYRHPNVLEAAVVARPDDEWGESPCAFILANPATDGLTGDAVIAWCRERLAGFKVPRTVVFGELPKTSTGKIQKHLLRERAKAL